MFTNMDRFVQVFWMFMIGEQGELLIVLVDY